MMSEVIKRNHDDDIYVDLEGRHRETFNVAAGLNKEDVYDFIKKFISENNNEDSVWWGEDTQGVNGFSIMVGYAQQFQNEFNAEFSAPEV